MARSQHRRPPVHYMRPCIKPSGLGGASLSFLDAKCDTSGQAGSRRRAEAPGVPVCSARQRRGDEAPRLVCLPGSNAISNVEYPKRPSAKRATDLSIGSPAEKFQSRLHGFSKCSVSCRIHTHVYLGYPKTQIHIQGVRLKSNNAERRNFQGGFAPPAAEPSMLLGPRSSADTTFLGKSPVRWSLGGCSRLSYRCHSTVR